MGDGPATSGATANAADEQRGRQAKHAHSTARWRPPLTNTSLRMLNASSGFSSAALVSTAGKQALGRSDAAAARALSMDWPSSWLRRAVVALLLPRVPAGEPARPATVVEGEAQRCGLPGEAQRAPWAVAGLHRGDAAREPTPGVVPPTEALASTGAGPSSCLSRATTPDSSARYRRVRLSGWAARLLMVDASICSSWTSCWLGLGCREQQQRGREVSRHAYRCQRSASVDSRLDARPAGCQAQRGGVYMMVKQARLQPVQHGVWRVELQELWRL